MQTRPGAFVENWLRRRAGVRSAQKLAEDALAALWKRAQRSVSDLALQALARCALETASLEQAMLADVRVGPRGFDLGALADAPRAELLAALGTLLVDLLALVHETSGAILAPALEAELLRVGTARRGGQRAPRGPRRVRQRRRKRPGHGAMRSAQLGRWRAAPGAARRRPRW